MSDIRITIKLDMPYPDLYSEILNQASSTQADALQAVENAVEDLIPETMLGQPVTIVEIDAEEI